MSEGEQAALADEYDEIVVEIEALEAMVKRSKDLMTELTDKMAGEECDCMKPGETDDGGEVCMNIDGCVFARVDEYLDPEGYAKATPVTIRVYRDDELCDVEWWLE